MTDSEFLGNNAFQFGGGIVQLDDGFMDIRRTLFDYNNADTGGGAIGIATASDADRWGKEIVSLVRCTSVANSPLPDRLPSAPRSYPPDTRFHALQAAYRSYRFRKPLSIVQPAVWGWTATRRYNLENCLFYSNTAGSGGGGVLYLLVDQDQAEYNGAGVVTFARWGNNNHRDRRTMIVQ